MRGRSLKATLGLLYAGSKPSLIGTDRALVTPRARLRVREAQQHFDGSRLAVVAVLFGHASLGAKRGSEQFVRTTLGGEAVPEGRRAIPRILQLSPSGSRFWSSFTYRRAGRADEPSGEERAHRLEEDGSLR